MTILEKILKNMRKFFKVEDFNSNIGLGGIISSFLAMIFMFLFIIYGSPDFSFMAAFLSLITLIITIIKFRFKWPTWIWLINTLYWAFGISIF